MVLVRHRRRPVTWADYRDQRLAAIERSSFISVWHAFLFAALAFMVLLG